VQVNLDGSHTLARSQDTPEGADPGIVVRRVVEKRVRF